MKKTNYPLKNLKVVAKNGSSKTILLTIFTVFSLSFTCISINNLKSYTNEYLNSQVVNKENTVSTYQGSVVPRITPVVSLPMENDTTSAAVDEVNTEETETETETEVETETTTIAETTSASENITDIELEVIEEDYTDVPVETISEEEDYEEIFEQETTSYQELNNYSSIDQYIYSLIDQYSGYDTRIDLNYDNIYLLSQLAYAEAGIEPFDGKVAVCEVCINRVFSSEFAANTIYDVIYSTNQFETVTNGSINNTPTESEVLAAVKAILGETPSNGALYFDNPTLCTSWASNNREKSCPMIGHHQFYW